MQPLLCPVDVESTLCNQRIPAYLLSIADVATPDACSQSRNKYRILPRPYAVPCINLLAAMPALSGPSSGEPLQWYNKVALQQRVPSAALPARLCPLATRYSGWGTYVRSASR